MANISPFDEIFESHASVLLVCMSRMGVSQDTKGVFDESFGEVVETLLVDSALRMDRYVSVGVGRCLFCPKKAGWTAAIVSCQRIQVQVVRKVRCKVIAH